MIWHAGSYTEAKEKVIKSMFTVNIELEFKIGRKVQVEYG